MAGRTVLLHLYQQGVTVTVRPQLHDMLVISAGLPFEPQLLSGPGPEVGQSRSSEMLSDSRFI